MNHNCLSIILSCSALIAPIASAAAVNPPDAPAEKTQREAYTAPIPIVTKPMVEFVTPSIARVRWTSDGTIADNATDACVYTKTQVEVGVSMKGGDKILTTDSLEVAVSPSGRIKFTDPATKRVLLVQEAPSAESHERVAQEKVVYDEASARMEDTANGKVTVKDVLRRDTLGYKDRYRISFTSPGEEALYGLGSHMEDYMNLAGKTLWLTQHNLKAFVPMLLSTSGYGILLDAGCSMKFESDVEKTGSVGGTATYTTEFTFTMEAAKTADYYFMKGDPNEVVAGYRFLTGDVAMMPRYLFGYIQSKERYVSSDDIVNTLKEYRRREVPIDMIVQDWNYWPEGWGYMKMNREFYPDPKALADSVHALDAKLMVSIWANPQYCPEEEDFRSRGFMLEHSVYDAFNPKARDLYWQYADNEFFSNGFDAWWCDSSEPLDGDWNRMPEPMNGRPYSWDDHERRWRLNDEVLSEALGAGRACLYSLNHSRGIYEHQRRATDKKRVVNLTRSTFAGQQRYATIVWNGDTHASWDSFRQQIPAGLNYLATGNPYWTVDVGCFFVHEDPRWFVKGKYPDGVKDDRYKELYTRMFQWATFLPVIRSHGTDTPREIWQFGEPGTPYYDAILSMILLRYSLLPYNYSMAAMMTDGGYSMARPLAFDFPADRNLYDIKDQYMFGDIMVSPVTSEGAASREVYLPYSKSGWFDFYSGRPVAANGMGGGKAYVEDGMTIVADAPLSRIPLYVKGGSIIPTTAPVQHSGAAVGQPITLTVYPGADADFTLYDDAGDGYGFEKGEWQRIPLKWNEATRTLTIGDAIGTFPGAPASRTFHVTLPASASSPTKTVNYEGKSLSISL